MSDMNTAGWEFDTERADEVHRDSRHNEFFGWCLAQMKEHRRVLPMEEPANGILGAASSLMTCGLDNETLQSVDTCVTIRDFVEEWGWPTTISLLGSAMRELEREVA